MKFFNDYIPLMCCDSSSKGKVEGGSDVNVSNVAEQKETLPTYKNLNEAIKGEGGKYIYFNGERYIDTTGGFMQIKKQKNGDYRVECGKQINIPQGYTKQAVGGRFYITDGAKDTLSLSEVTKVLRVNKSR